jgi:hypothetical protein
VDLSVGWAYAEVIVDGELGDHVDGYFGGGALLREELLEEGSLLVAPLHFAFALSDPTR